MVRVPQVDLPSVSVNSGGLPQFQAGQVAPAQNLAGQGAAQFGQGLEQAGAGLLRLQDRINDSRARAADTEFSEWSRAAVSEYRNKKGWDAIQARDQIVQDLNKKRKELAEGLDNQWQREAFEQRAAARSQFFSSSVDDHFTGQSTAYEIGQAKAALDANISDYSESFSSPQTITPMAESPFYKDAMGNVGTMMRAQGVQPGSPMWKQAEEQIRTQMHVNALAAMVQSQDPASRQMAREYYKQSKDDIPSAERAKIDSAMRKMDVDDISFAVSQQLLAEHPGDLMSQVQKLDIMRAGRMEEEEYAATLGKLTSRFNISQSAKAEQRNTMRNQYEQSLRSAIAGNQDWSAWQSENAAMVSQLTDLGMYDEAQSYWANRGRVTTMQGQERMVTYLATPSMLKADNGDIAAKWRSISAQLASSLSPQDMSQVETAFIRANQLDPNGQSPSGRGRAGDVVKIQDDKDFYRRMVAKLVGKDYQQEWERRVNEIGKVTNPGNPEMLDLWERSQRKLESEINQRNIDKNDRDAIEKYVNSLANSQGMVADSKALGISGQPINQFLTPLVYEGQTPEQRAAMKWTQPVEGAQQPITLTLGEWTANAQLRAEVKAVAQEQVKLYDRQLASTPSPALQEARDALVQAIQDDAQSGEDLTRIGGGTDMLVRNYLRMQAIKSAKDATQRNIQARMDARADNSISDSAELSNWFLLMNPVLEKLSPDQEISSDLVAETADAFIRDNRFGPSAEFGEDALGVAKRRAAERFVLKHLQARHPPTLSELQMRGGERFLESRAGTSVK